MTEARTETNLLHNRYRDIVPYDGKHVTVNSPTRDPQTTYINASLIKFGRINQTFIATQAPKLNSVDNFWQMIIEKQALVIVMITGLQEGEKKKADQYWPDQENKVMDLDNGIKLVHKDSSYHGTYFTRTIQVQTSEGGNTLVSQLQTTEWLDRTAPDNTKILLDLVHKTREIVGSIADPPIAVHCSAGVGRTGTFIAVYKLFHDYLDQEVTELDLQGTVVEMRRQRMKMVQKFAQYRYIALCLRELVKTEEGGYYITDIRKSLILES
eukprot:GFUD01083196.1.p1 GENE.GFUD01083196.1~~GFUD01083196.1.p1  ORF type:complete len:292 (-),score=81.24 GFUD01083196.1:8-811(-)